MTDRELLELAEKAAGYAIHGRNQAGRDACGAGSIGLWITNHTTCWNPLTDDGDALRLAVKLRITIEHPNPADLGGGHVIARIWKQQYRYHFLKETSFNEVFDQDPYAATRRAIVRAAAEIGRTMK